MRATPATCDRRPQVSLGVIRRTRFDHMKALPESGDFMVPDDLDGDAMLVVQKQAAKYSESAPIPWRSFAGAWNGVTHRYRSAHDFDLAFVEAMAAGDGPPLKDRYQQELALFGFASAALSTLECCAFAAYCLGALARPDVFPVTIDRDLRFYPPQVRDTFLKAYPGHLVGDVLADVLGSSEYERLADLRNVLSHRGTLPRSFHVSVGTGPHARDGAFIPSNPKSISSDWLFNQPVDATLTQVLRTWLGLVQARLVQAITAFASVHL